MNPKLHEIMNPKLHDIWQHSYYSYPTICKELPDFIVKKVFVEEKSILNDSPIILNLK